MHIGGMVSGAEAILLLTDRDGVILDIVGDTSTLDWANRINLRVGGMGSEDASGTNGIGTALWAGKPVFVHVEEHFCEGMTAWSCACAPIRDPIDRSIIGAINLSGLTAIFQKHNAAFAATAAREIEIVLECEPSMLHLHLLKSIIGTVPLQTGLAGEGIAVVDRLGRLIFNRNCGGLPQFAGSGAVVKNGFKLFSLCNAASVATLNAAREGAMAAACAPTLVLDEIGELPAEIQPFLLRALEQRANGQSGDDPALSVISLTNRVMLDEVAAGRFRRDLFYRLGTVTLTIPPPSERGDDILLIAEHYNRKISNWSGRELLILPSDAQER